MEPRGASSFFPLAIRARLSTDDSTSDASSSASYGDSDSTSGVDVTEEQGYETAEVDAASLRQTFMPRARITGDDEDDDILEEVEFENNVDDEEENLKLVVDSEAESSIGEDYEDFAGALVSERAEGGLSNQIGEKDDILGDGGFVISSLEKLQLRVNNKGYFEKVETMPAFGDAWVNDNGLLKEVKLEADGSDPVNVDVEKYRDSISTVDKTEDVRSGDVEQKNDFFLQLEDSLVAFRNINTKNDNHAGGIEDFDGGFVSGREESGVTTGNSENDDNLVDKGLVIASLEELKVQVKEKGFLEKLETLHAFENALANDGNLELNEVKLGDGSDVVEVEVEEDMHFIPTVYGKIGAVSSGDVEQSSSFDLELKDLVVESSNIVTKEDNLATTHKSAMEVKLNALGYEEKADNLGISDPEKYTEEIVKLGAIGAIIPNQYCNQDMQSKAEETEFSVWEIIQEEASQVEADSTEFKGFEASSAIDFNHRQILEPLSLPDSKVFEPEAVEADNTETKKDNYLSVNPCPAGSQIARESSANAYESSYPIKEICTENTAAYSAESLDNIKEKHDESRTIVTQVSIAENYNACECYSDELSSSYASEKEMESRFDSFHVAHDEGSGEEDELVISEWPASGATLENSEILKHILEEMEESCTSSHSGFKSSQNYSHILETEEDGGAKELFDTSALAALLRAANGAYTGISDLTSEDSSSIFFTKHQAGFRSTTSFPRPIHTPCFSACAIASSNQKITGEYGNRLNDEDKMLNLRADQIRLKYRCLVQRLGYFADDAFPNHVLYQLGLVSGVTGGRKIRKELYPQKKCKDDFTFSCNILVLGKTGVGKSAAINSIFGEERASVDPFRPATTSVREISGMVNGVYITVIDTPGLLPSLNDQGANRKILSSIKRYTRRAPDVVLYIDRLDTHSQGSDDLFILRMITSVLGSSIWHNAIIALTHASSVFFDGPDGSPLSYEVIVARRSRAVQQAIRQAAGDINLVNPVALVENHHSCSKDMDGERLLPNGLRWRAWLLLLCYSTKILSEINSVVKPSRNQEDDDYDFVIDSDKMTDAVLEGDDEYDQLPFFKSLRKAHVQKQTNEQKNAYFDKYDYLLNLQQRKQLNDEQEFEQEVNPSNGPIPLPDLVSTPSFNNENTAYFYQFPEPKSQFLTRRVMYTHYWDHVGISFTFLGETLVNGFKLEDLVFQGKELCLVAGNGVTKSDFDYGMNFEYCSSRKRLFTSDQFVIKLKDFFLGAILQFEFSTQQSSRISVRLGINNPKSAHVSIKTSTTRHVHVALLGFFTIMLSICRSIWTKVTIKVK